MYPKSFRPKWSFLKSIPELDQLLRAVLVEVLHKVGGRVLLPAAAVYLGPI
jgi:hypothetical protein